MSRRRKKTTKMDLVELPSESTTLANRVKNCFNTNQVKRVLLLGNDLFEAISPVIDEPNWWNGCKAAFAVGKVFIDDMSVWVDGYFADDHWVEPYNSDFNGMLMEVLQAFPFERLKTNEEDAFVHICKPPNGLKLGWTYKSKLLSVEHIYVEVEHLEKAQAFIKELLWSRHNESSLIMRRNSSKASGTMESQVVIEADTIFEPKLSKRAVEFSEHLKKPLVEGVARSIMFYGPPGTGKSTMARTIVDLLKLRSFRIRVGDLEHIDGSTIYEAINIFQPDAVILDDFDRSRNQAELLETLEFFHQKVKLVITTVNNKALLDDALLRPGRIDMIELVDAMDEEVVKHVLGKYVDGYELVKGWPICYVDEYVKRRSYLSAAEAAESVKELTRRVQELEHYRGDSDPDGMQRMLKILGPALKRGKGKRKDSAAQEVQEIEMCDDEEPDEP